MMSMRGSLLRIVALVGLWFVVQACGSNSTSSSDGGAGSCPSSANGTGACTSEGASCEGPLVCAGCGAGEWTLESLYGCVCTSGAWRCAPHEDGACASHDPTTFSDSQCTVHTVADAGLDAPSDAASCPSTQPASSTPGSPGPGGPGPNEVMCSADGANCSYGATCCVCETTASCGGQVLWWCGTTQAPPPCPATLPMAGGACAGVTGQCTYCTGSGLLAATCNNGQWSVAPPTFGCAG
jgi:hypothetical protein